MPSSFVLRSPELGELANDLARAAGRSTTIARTVQEKYGRLVVKEAIRRAPEDTGALKRSIKLAPPITEADRLGYSAVAIEADTRPETGRGYSGFVEFGTSNMAPQPFLRPALRKYAKDYREALVDAAAEEIGSKRGALAAIAGKSLFRGSSALSLDSALTRSDL